MGTKTGIATMVKSTVHLNVMELKRKLRNRQLDAEGQIEELRDRLESWIIDNSHKVDEYEIEESEALMAKMGNMEASMQGQLRTEMDCLR